LVRGTIGHKTIKTIRRKPPCGREGGKGGKCFINGEKKNIPVHLVGGRRGRARDRV